MDNKGRKGPAPDARDRPQRRGFRGTAENAKTKICQRWQNGECRFGDRCNFAHGDDELRNLPPRNPGAGPPGGGGGGRGRGRGGDSFREDFAPGPGRGSGRGQGGRGGGGRGGGAGDPRIAQQLDRDHSAWVASGRPIKGPNGWTQYQTESGEKYYNNSNTNVTQWEPPAEWKGQTA